MSLGRARRRVAVVTGTRAEFGILGSTLRAIDSHPRLSLDLIVTGMHLLRRFGLTVREIERQGWRVAARVRMQNGDDDPLDQARGLARGVRGLAESFSARRADIVVVLGDRIEAMAGALAAVATGRILAHIHGGDIAPGDFDEGFRHAITKLAHLHLAATRDARRRIIRMGERREHVHVVGAPGLDDIVELRKKVRRSARPRGGAVVLYHPSGRSAAEEQRTMRAILRAADAARLSSTVVYPNSDRGHSGILAAIEERAGRAGGPGGAIKVHRSLPREAFLRLLTTSDVLIGNSSCGIIEAPMIGAPSVNIGRRQEGRERGGPSVIDADESEISIRRALSRALHRRPIRRDASIYGRGDAGMRIAQILASARLDDHLRRKVNVF